MQQPPAEREVLAVGLEIVPIEVVEVVVVSVFQRDGGRLYVWLWVCQTDDRGKVGTAAKQVELNTGEDVEE